MNLAFRFPAFLSVTIGHHAVGVRTPKFIFLGVRWDRINSGSTVTLTFVSARFLVSLRTTGCLLNIFLRDTSGRDYERITNTLLYEFITHVMRTHNRCEKFVRVLHRSEGFERICHICEKFARIIHRCEKYVRMFHTCDRFV